MISDGKTYQDNQELMGITADQLRQLSLVMIFTKDYEKPQRKFIRKIKQRSVRNIASINRLSAGLSAAIKVAERQIALLQNLHTVFLTSYRTKTKDREKRYPPQKTHFWTGPIPVLSEYPEQAWQNILDAIDEVVRERKSFIREIKELVGMLDIKRKIV